MKKKILSSALFFILIFIFNSSFATENWQNNWAFKEAPIIQEQLYDACTLLNESHETATCYPNAPLAITLYQQIPNAALVDVEIAQLRLDIRGIQSLAMSAGEDVLMIDKSREPHMAGIYGFKNESGDYGGRLYQRSYTSLKAYCQTYKIEPWFCNAEKP